MFRCSVVGDAKLRKFHRKAGYDRRGVESYEVLKTMLEVLPLTL